jgi:poly(A) polymerase/tRNA nucleotidyltransferase (CCA-adding enzyme)
VKNKKESPAYYIPSHVLGVVTTLQKAGFEAYLVGGCVRDILMENKPKDWDVTTNARPEQIQALFNETFYENEYGTVGVVVEDLSREKLNIVSQETFDELSRESMEALEVEPRAPRGSTSGADPSPKEVIEVTPYRLETKYSNFRHPDAVTFSTSLGDDLKRRDLTINAIAYDPNSPKGQFIDPFNGLKDIKDMVIRAVGEPSDRFCEDALRMMRAVRLAAQLGFMIDPATEQAIVANKALITKIAAERIHDELMKLLNTEYAVDGIRYLKITGLLELIIPELLEGIGIEQRGEHIYDVWEHNLKSLEHAVKKGWPFHVRLAVLLHDVGKPRTRLRDEERQIWTFHGHDVVGGKMTKKILERLKFSREMIDNISKLVRYHLFFSDTDKITLSAVRRMIRNVGADLIWDLMKVRQCDRIGTGRPKESPYRLRKYEAMIEEAMRDPISVQMLKIDGAKIMEIGEMDPGPKIGWVLHALLEEVLEDPAKNTTEYLETHTKKLLALSDKELQELGEAGKEKKSGLEEAAIEEINKRHYVK